MVVSTVYMDENLDSIEDDPFQIIQYVLVVAFSVVLLSSLVDVSAEFLIFIIAAIGVIVFLVKEDVL